MINTKPQPIQFTKAGYEKLKTDLSRLTIEREEVIKRLQAAREMGDLSENGMYKAAKFELGNIDRQVRRINTFLRFGIVTMPANNGTVSFGSTITLKTNEKEVTYTLVNEHESNPSKGKLSFKSPLGSLLLGKKAGESVFLETANGKSSYMILNIE